MSVLTVHDSIGFLQTVGGGTLIRGGVLNRQIMGCVICITLHLYVCLSVWSDQTKSRKELSHAVKMRRVSSLGLFSKLCDWLITEDIASFTALCYLAD